jgi:iron complex transport system ATP-binding protein
MPGEVFVLVGPNGAGKSTLLRVLAGDIRPTEGRLLLDGRVLAEYRPEELAIRRAVLLQQVVLQFAFTVQEVVAMGRYPQRRRCADDPDEDERAIQRAMQHTETLDLAARIFPTLSGGEQERTSLARVLAQQTPILLLDEPTSSLDIRHQELVMGVARDLAGRGASVLAILHDLNLAAAYAHRIGLLHRGRLVVCGSPWEVLSESTLSHVFDHPITVMPHPARDCPLILPLPHRDRCAASTPHAIGCHEFSA